MPVSLESMHLRNIASVLRCRRFWVWEIGGAVIYAVPAAIRLAIGSSVLPLFSLLATPSLGYYVPSNLVEKIIVNAFFPGGAGAIAGELYFSSAYAKKLEGKQKYFARLSGALLQTGAWSLLQLSGGLLGIAGSWGGNLFEYPSVFPLNFLLASLSIFTPDVLGFLKKQVGKAYGRLKRGEQR